MCTHIHIHLNMNVITYREMIKCCISVLISNITKLFNLILDSGYYPETWNHGPIYTNGS